MLLDRDEAWPTFQKIISESFDFIYLISAWVGRMFAKELENIGAANNIIIVLRDLEFSNSRIIKYLEHFDVRIYNVRPLHDKFLITNKGVMVGSANFTKTSFFDEENHIQYYDNLTVEWKEFYNLALKIIEGSISVNSLSPYIDKKELSFDDINEKISQLEKSQNQVLVENTQSYNIPKISTNKIPEIQVIKSDDRKLSLSGLSQNNDSDKKDPQSNNSIANIIRLLKKL